MTRLFLTEKIETVALKEVPLRLLAHLGDAVLHLYERERQILQAANAKQMHNRVSLRVNAEKQARLLDGILPKLSYDELDLVRRARNLKGANYRKAEQTAYRKATALEALVGHLYLTDSVRLAEILALTTACRSGD